MQDLEQEPIKTKNVFTNRNFRLVFFGALVSELGALMYSFSVGFYLLDISGNNAFLQGLYLALCGIVMLVFTPIGGVMGDRINKARIMVVCDYLRGGMILLATLLMIFFSGSEAQILILFVVGMLGNAVGGIFSPASGALLPYIVEEKQIQQAASYFSGKNSLITIFGIVLAGILYSLLPITVLFFFVGCCYLLSGISEMFIRYSDKKKEGNMGIKTVLGDMRDGITYLKGKKAILAILFSILFINLFFAPVTQNFTPFFIKTDVAGARGYLLDRWLTPELWMSVVEMMLGIASLAASVILSGKEQDRKCGKKIARRMCILAAEGIGLAVAYWLLVDRGISLNAFLVLFALGSAFLGFLLVYINVPINTALMVNVDKEMLSKVNSITGVLSQGLIPLASVLAGIILQVLGSSLLLAVCAAGLSVTAIILLFNKASKEI